MKNKLFVITAGTVAASVGQELIKQMKAHPQSDLQVMVRYIDTAYLPNRYQLRTNEWFQMSIGQRYMTAIHSRINEYKRLKDMLFPNLLPGTANTGGGSIRYNGAGAVEVQRDYLQSWLSSSMAELAQSGNSQANISIALIISAVGATGSGSLEHLLDVIVDAANHARIHSASSKDAIRCDVYILQPRNGVTELGLANTLALYAELAASQLTLQASSRRQYQGRKILIDWGGSAVALSSLDQLIESAATILRLSNDASTPFAAEFQEREVDHHVLRELDQLCGLPMHLSTVTIVTISLGNLVEQVIQQDVAHLIEHLAFGKTIANTSDILLSKLAHMLAGEDSRARYRKLLEYLIGESGLQKMRKRLDNIIEDRDANKQDKISRLQRAYNESLTEIRQSRHRVHDQSRIVIDDALQKLGETRREELVNNGRTLQELREEARELENAIDSILLEARNDIQVTKVNEDPINKLIDDLTSRGLSLGRSQQERFEQLVKQMKRNLQGSISEIARDSAIDVLEALKSYCAAEGLNLDVVLNQLRRQRDAQEGWAAVYREENNDTGHPQRLMALSTPEEIRDYKEKVSIFANRGQSGRTTNSGTNQIVEFRHWLLDKIEFEALFEGDMDQLVEVTRRYTEDKVLSEINNKRKVIDVLLEAGEEVLKEKLREAVAKTASMVSYDPNFAQGCREVWHVSADYGNNSAKRNRLERIISEIIPSHEKLLSSTDPTEVVIYYYVDGIPMSAVEDLKGRCLDALIRRRQQWLSQQTTLGSNGNTPVSSLGSLNQRVGVPVYSGQDAENRVIETGVLHRLYQVKGSEVRDYDVSKIPEMNLPNPQPVQGTPNPTSTSSGQPSSSPNQANPPDQQSQANYAAGYPAQNSSGNPGPTLQNSSGNPNP